MPAQVGNIGVNLVIALTGVASASAVGSLGVDTSVALSGNASVSAVGSVTVETGAGATLTGVESTSAVGSVGFTKSGSSALTGVFSTTAVGSVALPVIPAVAKYHTTRFNLDTANMTFSSIQRQTLFNLNARSTIMEMIEAPEIITFILLESGDFLLLESGDKLERE